MRRERGYVQLAVMIVLAIGTAGVAYGGWRIANGWCNDACDEARYEVTKLSDELATTTAERDGWIEVAAKQNVATKAAADKADTRRREALAAIKAADERAKSAEARIAELLAAQPSDPKDPCISACVLLRSPL